MKWGLELRKKQCWYLHKILYTSLSRLVMNFGSLVVSLPYEHDSIDNENKQLGTTFQGAERLFSWASDLAEVILTPLVDFTQTDIEATRTVKISFVPGANNIVSERIVSGLPRNIDFMLQEEDLVRHFDQTLPNNAIIAEHGYVVWPGGLFSGPGDSHCTEFCGAGRRQKRT